MQTLTAPFDLINEMYFENLIKRCRKGLTYGRTYVILIMRGHNKGGDDYMSPRTGRPPLQDTSRNEKLNIRLTQEEKEDIQYCAEKLNISRTDVIMKGIDLVKVEIQKK